MPVQRTYPAGVPSWIDLETAEPEQTTAFYGDLLGWTFEDVRSSDAGRYLVARLDGLSVCAVASGDAVLGELGQWNTAIEVDDVEAAARAVTAASGYVLNPPQDTPVGRIAVCVDPQGAGFRLRQADDRVGAQAVNRAGGWGFSDLRTSEIDGSKSFYSAVLGWTYTDLGYGEEFVTVAGYGDHLAHGADPGIRERHAATRTPADFADVVARMQRSDPGEDPRWRVSFGVDDADAAAEAVARLGGRVWSRSESAVQRLVNAADPLGIPFTLSQYTPRDAS